MHDALVRGRRSELAGRPLPTPTRATLAVRALRLALNSFYCGYAAWNSVAVNFKILLYLKFKNSKILLRRILPLEFRLWRRFLSRGKGRYLLYFAVLARNATRLKLCITTLVLRGRSPSRPKPHLTPDDASGADCVRAFLFCGCAARFDFKISCRKNRKISIALQIGAVFC